MNHPGHIINDYTTILYCRTSQITWKFVEIENKMDKYTVKVTEKFLKSIKTIDAAIVQLILSKPMVVESFNEFSPFGRFTVRDITQTVTFDVIKETQKKALTEVAIGGKKKK